MPLIYQKGERYCPITQNHGVVSDEKKIIYTLLDCFLCHFGIS